MRELELKLSVDDPFVTPSLRPEGTGVAGMEELPELDLRATYYDTADLRLARHGVTLRYRTGEDSGPGWDLKLPVGHDGEAADRNELHFEAPAGRIPDAARDLVTAYARSAPLRPVARLNTRRRRWCLRDADGGELAELVDDRVSVIKQGRVVERFRELEIESRELDRNGLERIAALFRQAGASAPAATPKVVRALGPKATLPPDVVARDRLWPDEPTAYAVQAAIARGVLRIFHNDPGARLGEVEPVHQMRVGARRLRSDLRTFAPLVDEAWSRRLRDELRWLGTALGDVRDLDVMNERLRSSSEGLGRAIEPLFAFLEEQHLVARAGLLNALRSQRFVTLMDELVAAARSPALTEAAWEPAGRALPPLAQAAWRRLALAGRAISDEDPDERYHDVRIKAKRARYAAEAVAPALGPKRGKQAKQFAKLAAAIQDVLGSLQDAVVARKLVTDVLDSRPDDASFALAAGRLLERQEQSGREARASFADGWSKLDRSKNLQWLES